MVRAILAGRKTQTRRIVKPQGASMFPMLEAGGTPRGDWFISRPKYERFGNSGHLCPYGRPGDRLWVRETWAYVPTTAYRCSEGVQQTANPNDSDMAAVYAAGWDRSRPSRWRPSIHMPRWASRISLEITSVRAERLQEISEADAMAEGVERNAHDDGSWTPADGWLDYLDLGKGGDGFPADTARESYLTLWQSINGAGSWSANPWVWVIEFKRHYCRMDYTRPFAADVGPAP